MADITFDCPHCGNEIVIDQRGIGMEVACPHCAEMIRIEASATPAEGEDPGSSRPGESEFDCRIIRNSHFVQPMWSLEVRIAGRTLELLRQNPSRVLARGTIAGRDTKVIIAEEVARQIGTFGRYESIFKDHGQAQRLLDEIESTLLSLHAPTAPGA